MLNKFLTNDQKLDFIFQILREQEIRRRRDFWWGMIRRAIFLGFLVIIFFYYPIIIAKIVDIMKPIILEQAEGLVNDNKEELIEKARRMLEGGQ